MITTINDIYDIYGTIEELELFAHAVERWDLQVVEELPEYMRPCYLTLFNFLNEIGYKILVQQGCNIIPFLKRKWEELCKSYLVEAKWFYEGYKPTLEEYLNNASVSISTQALLSNVFFLMNQEKTMERLVLLDNCPNLMHASSVSLRLTNDLATSDDEQSRGDVLKVVQCYMHEKGVSEEVAREHVKELISESWKKMNKHLILGSSFYELWKKKMNKHLFQHVAIPAYISSTNSLVKIVLILTMRRRQCLFEEFKGNSLTVDWMSSLDETEHDFVLENRVAEMLKTL